MPQVYRVYLSSVFIGLVSQYTFFIHLESISSFRKFSTVNHQRQNLNSAQDNTHISTSTLFSKFTVIHKENTTSNFSYPSSAFPEKVLVKMVRRLLAFLNCKDITIFSSRYLHASSGSGLKYFSVFGPLRFPVFLLSFNCCADSVDFFPVVWTILWASNFPLCNSTNNEMFLEEPLLSPSLPLFRQPDQQPPQHILRPTI